MHDVMWPCPSSRSSLSQFEGSEPLTNSILGQRQRPTSDINNSSSISPAHPKVTRSISANQKQRRYSDHGGDDDGGGVVEKPSKVTSSFPVLGVLVAACFVGGSCSQILRIGQKWDTGVHPADLPLSEHSNTSCSAEILEKDLRRQNPSREQ